MIRCARPSRSWRATLPAGEAKVLLVQLEEAPADLDSTTDVLTAQAVHSATKGKLAEAAATLSVAGAGDAGIPQLTVPSVHRESRLITHRVLAVLGAPTRPPPSPSLLALAEPAVAAWLDGLLPALDQVRVAADVSGGGRWMASLGALGLSAIEVVALAAAGGDLASGRLGALLAARARHEAGGDPGSAVTFADAGPGAASLADVAVAAGALQERDRQRPAPHGRRPGRRSG